MSDIPRYQERLVDAHLNFIKNGIVRVRKGFVGHNCPGNVSVRKCRSGGVYRRFPARALGPATIFGKNGARF